MVDLEFLSFIAGKDLSTGAVNVPQYEVLSSTSNVLTLTQTPVANTLKIYALLNSRDKGTEQTAVESAPSANQYTISGTTVTLGGTVADGTEYKVYYDYQAGATTKTITFTANNFAGYVRLTGDGIVTDQYTGDTEIVKFDFKKCKPIGTYNLTMSGGSEATMLEMEFDLYSVNVGSDKVYATMHELV